MTYAEQVAALAAEIAPVLKVDFVAETYAAGLIDENDEDDGHYEVRGHHTKSGAPFTCRVG